jgi:LacI family transcriptional regulator
MQSIALIFFSFIFTPSKLRMATRRTTIHDIAKELNMTASTVSRALNDHPKISQATKILVQNKAKEMNYTTNVLAASLRTGKAQTIGLVVPRINRVFISNTIAGIESVTNRAGYNIIICQSDEKQLKEEQNINTLINSRVDGIIMAISFGNNSAEHIERARKEGIPVVQFDRIREDVPVSNVLNDNEEISYQAVKHLISQGYRRIVHFAGPQHINIYRQRFGGYKKALLEHGFEFDENLVFSEVLDKERGFQTFQQIIDNKLDVDAVFSASDYSAMGALLAAKENNISIPEQLGIVGFANEPFTEFIDPSMTTIDQRAVEMGAEVARLILDEIENPSEVHNPQSITMNCKLIVRQSSNRLKVEY